MLISAIQTWYYQNRQKVFDSWILLKWLCSKVMPSFTLRSARPYTKYCSYSARIRIGWHGNGDLWPHCTDCDVYVDNGGLRLSCPSQPVSVYDWLCNTRSKRRGGLYSLASYGYIRYQSTCTCTFYLTRAINASRALIYKYCAFYIYGAHNSTLDCMQSAGGFCTLVLHFLGKWFTSCFEYVQAH